MQTQSVQQGGRPPMYRRRANLRLALVLASVAALFALGFVAKIAWFNA